MEQTIYERNSMTSMVSVMPNQVPEAILALFFGVTKMMLYLGYGPFPVTVANKGLVRDSPTKNVRISGKGHCYRSKGPYPSYTLPETNSLKILIGNTSQPTINFQVLAGSFRKGTLMLVIPWL